MNKRLLIAIIPVISFSIIMISITNYASSIPTLDYSTNSKSVITSSNGVSIIADQSSILVKTGIDKISVNRGTTATIPVTFTYNATSQQKTPVTILFSSKNNQAILIPPSVASKYTDDEKLSFLTSNTLPSDVIDLYSLTSFVPGKLTLMPGQTATVDMYIKIPNSWPDEMLNKPVTFNVNHEDLPPMKEKVNGPISVEVVVIG